MERFGQSIKPEGHGKYLEMVDFKNEVSLEPCI